MADKFQNKYRIPSARLQNWDYGNNAAYFVTICTENREHYFGEIENGTMILSELGIIAHEFWKEIPQHFPYIKLDAFIIMPNHMHGIIIIDYPTNIADEKNPSNIAGTNNRTDVACKNKRTDVACENNCTDVACNVSSRKKNEKMAAISPKSGSLSTIIRSYKSAVTKHARQMGFDFAWQTRFHDNVIRNDESYHRIRQYIINNPVKWDKDKFFNTNDNTNTNLNKI